MELLVKAIQQLPAREAQYTDRQTGEIKPFFALPVIFSDGFSTFVAELVNEVAQSCNISTAEGVNFYKVDVRFSTRNYTDNKGMTRYQNEAIIRAIQPWY